ncbi:MAG: methionyl-tRNA formyltransferase [Lachnospiraceae bacterium]|nr:methionyl-tRNA formyltransferase [Lachnospiraceae bacterium]
MRIGYFADGPWAHRAFEKIVTDDSVEIAFMTVRYDRKDEVLINLADRYRIPVELDKNINSRKFIDTVKNYYADLFVSMSFDQIFKTEMIHLPKYGTINCHAGKLPFYRGRNVLNWALINDEKEFGITVHYMDTGIDTGDIILQDSYPITDNDDYGTLLEKAYDGCAVILYKAIKIIQSGQVRTIRQNDIDPVGTYCGMRMAGDEIVNWNWSSREIFNFIRALCIPGPQAVSWIKGNKISINRAKMVEGAHQYKNIPGQVIGKTADGILVKTGDTMLEITEYTYAGKVKVGDRLQDHE